MRKSRLLLLLPLLTACGTADNIPDHADAAADGSSSDLTPLAPPSIGVQLVSTKVTVAPGEEKYLCWSSDVPADAPLDLVAIQNQMPRSTVHHYAVFTNTDAPKDPNPYECSTMGPTWGLVSGGGLSTPSVEFPSGTAMTLAASTHVVFQLHLLNADSAPVDVPPAYINLVGAPPGQKLQPVGLLIVGTLGVNIPAHGKDVTATANCKLDNPMSNVFAVFPHMHQLGRRITAEVTPSGGGAPVSLSDVTWDFKDQGLYKVAGSAAVGDQVAVTCHYDNPSASAVTFGLSSTDEMCVEVFYHYPASSLAVLCGFQ